MYSDRKIRLKEMLETLSDSGKYESDSHLARAMNIPRQAFGTYIRAESFPTGENLGTSEFRIGYMSNKFTLVKIIEDGSAKTFVYEPVCAIDKSKSIKDKLIDILIKIRNLTPEKVEQLYQFLRFLTSDHSNSD